MTAQQTSGQVVGVKAAALQQAEGLCAVVGPGAQSGSVDGTVRLWDLESGKEIRRFRGHTADVGCVAFTADGRRALSGGADRTIRLWDVASGRELWCFQGHTDIVFSIALAPDGRHFLSSSKDGSARLWRFPQEKKEPLPELPRTTRTAEPERGK